MSTSLRSRHFMMFIQMLAEEEEEEEEGKLKPGMVSRKKTESIKPPVRLFIGKTR
jgi:hypothetical protein